MDTFDKTYQLPFTVPMVYAHWVSNGTVIAPAERMEIDPRIGGTYRLVMSGDVRMDGVFSHVVPEQSLKYSWQWHGSNEKTQVSVDFNATGDGTTVHIVHSGFTNDDSYANHASGWDNYIVGFTLHLENQP